MALMRCAAISANQKGIVAGRIHKFTYLKLHKFEFKDSQCSGSVRVLEDSFPSRGCVWFLQSEPDKFSLLYSPMVCLLSLFEKVMCRASFLQQPW